MHQSAKDQPVSHLFAPEKIIHGTVSLPASKSISNRLLLLEALSGGRVVGEGLSESEDTIMMRKALLFPEIETNIGHAGTAMRFLTAFFALTPGAHILTGSDRMKKRPIRKLVDALRILGADIEYTGEDGFPPLLIQGKTLTGSMVSIDGSTSSQYISALLMIAPLLPEGLSLSLEGTIISASYIRLTLDLMEKAGINHEWNGKVIRIPKQEYKAVTIKAEVDWSAASYWYELASLSEGAEILVKGLAPGSLQGDSNIALLFEQLGVHTHYVEEGAILTSVRLAAKQFSYDFIEMPDMVQTFAVSCVLNAVPFIMHGTQSLRIKETDRITALKTELGKLGARIEYSSDGTLAWNGKIHHLHHNLIRIPTYLDHRMAMAFAPASVKLKELVIENPEVVSKSYPTYWEELKGLGFIIK
jgi:3-phosphoshikimate 1-carboxyvinyltransferase